MNFYEGVFCQNRSLVNLKLWVTLKLLPGVGLGEGVGHDYVVRSGVGRGFRDSGSGMVDRDRVPVDVFVNRNVG
jgi:hypothetical protein